MKRIQLKQYGVGRYEDVSPFPLGDLEIELLGIPSYSGEFRFVAHCNGVKCAESTVSATQNRVKIPRDKLNAGRLSCFVSHYGKGTEVKRYLVEDLIVSELETDLFAYPEIADMEQRIEKLSASLAAEKAARIRLEEKSGEDIAYTREIVLGLLKFAFEDYRENVYLHGGTFEEFLQCYGIDLSEIPEEKIKKIKGEKENAEID